MINTQKEGIMIMTLILIVMSGLFGLLQDKTVFV